MTLDELIAKLQEIREERGGELLVVLAPQVYDYEIAEWVEYVPPNAFLMPREVKGRDGVRIG